MEKGVGNNVVTFKALAEVIGVITELLARKTKHVTCIELDLGLECFINVLKEKYNNIDVIYANALNVYIPPCDKII